MYYTVIKHSGHLRTLEKCRKYSPAARVFYISLVFSNARRVLSQCNTRLRLLYLLNKTDILKIFHKGHNDELPSSWNLLHLGHLNFTVWSRHCYPKCSLLKICGKTPQFHLPPWRWSERRAERECSMSFVIAPWEQEPCAYPCAQGLLF